MKAIVLDQPGKFSLQEIAPPDAIQDNEALVRVLRVGICGTDIHAFDGTQPFFSYPRILGHELAVEIIQLGSSSEPHSLAVGDICTVEPYLNCGQCSACRRGHTNACVRLSVLGVHQDGGMCEEIIIPIRKLHNVNSLPPEDAALVEMLCIGAHAVRRAAPNPGENVLVIGAGPIGLGTMQFARQANANVIALDVNPARLDFCRETLNIAHVVTTQYDPVAEIRDILHGEMPTIVFDATGSQQSMMDAFRYVSHAGKLVYIGITQKDITFSDPYFHSHEISLLASRNATYDDFERVTAALTSGAISLKNWVTHRATPEELPALFPTWLNPDSGLVKAVLTF